MNDQRAAIEREVKRPRWANVGKWVCIFVGLFLAAGAFYFARTGSATTEQLDAQGARRDCVTLLSTARRAVFDNVDIYKAIQIEQLSTVLLNVRQGISPTDADAEAFATNDALLRDALVEARRLQPPSVLTELIERGGTIDGVRYTACPT